MSRKAGAEACGVRKFVRCPDLSRLQRDRINAPHTVRYRLDRGGDRQLNRALHMIIVTRRRAHPDTIAYIKRRREEGKNSREATRCLKRYLARNLYRLLENGTPLPT